MLAPMVAVMPKAPLGQGWYGLPLTARVEDDHRGGPDEAVYRKRDQPGRQAGLAVHAYQLVRVPVADHGGDSGHDDHGQGGCDADEPVSHRGPRWSRATLQG